MGLSSVSETSQYWDNLSYMIIFGLPLGTVLTLVVVPAIYSLVESAPETMRSAYGKVKRFVAFGRHPAV
jgi:hypothetical protein